MRANPNLDKVCGVLYCKSAVIDPGSYGPQLTDFLEMQGRVGRVIFQKIEVFSSDGLNTFR